MTLRENVDFQRDHRKVLSGEKIARIDTTVTKLTNIQKEQLQAMQEMKKRSTVKSRNERIEKNRKMVLGNYGDLYGVHDDRVFNYETHGFFSFMFDVLLCMFVGMAFFNSE